MTFILGDLYNSPEIHVGDVGTRFVTTVYDQDSAIVPLQDSISIKFRFYKPDRVSVEKTGSLETDGTDGKTFYVSETGFFDISGKWKYCVIVQLAGGTWSSNWIEFDVYPIIPAPAA